MRRERQRRGRRNDSHSRGSGNMRVRSMLIFAGLLTLLGVVVVRAEDAPPTTAPASGGGGAASGDVNPAIAAFMKPMQADQDDDALRQKLKERHNTAVRLLELRVNAYH